MAFIEPRREHKVTVVVGDKEIGKWTDYEIESSMIEPADSFHLSRAFDLDAWKLCRLDENVKVMIDGIIILDGYIDDRGKSARAGTMTIAGRDKSGRLVQDSAPDFTYGGQRMSSVIKRLAEPIFPRVSLTDERNRRVRRGRGSRAPAPKEPAVIDSVLPSGHIDPGRTRYAIIEEIAAQLNLLVWSSADGRELIVGKPNYDQGIQYVIRHTKPGSRERATCKDLDWNESCGDRYARIIAVGSGRGSAANYGDNVTSRRAQSNDGPAPDGTGRDFLRPKTLVLPEASLRDAAHARDAARLERARRDFQRNTVRATMAAHGQIINGAFRIPTLFSPNTLAQVIDEELEVDESFLIYMCSYRSSRRGGESTIVSLVPKGLEIVP